MEACCAGVPWNQNQGSTTDVDERRRTKFWCRQGKTAVHDLYRIVRKTFNRERIMHASLSKRGFRALWHAQNVVSCTSERPTLHESCTLKFKNPASECRLVAGRIWLT
jgi:hypothetical protein